MSREWRSPDGVRLLPPMSMLYARAMRVRESTSRTTSLPASTSRCARENAISATDTCAGARSSSDEAITSPWIERRMSVTSSGRSLMSSTITLASG